MRENPDHQWTLEQKLERSRSRERIDFSKFLPTGSSEQLVEVVSSESILVEPY